MWTYMRNHGSLTAKRCMCHTHLANKKVIQCDRKRLTTRGIASTHPPVRRGGPPVMAQPGRGIPLPLAGPGQNFGQDQ